MGGKVNGSAKDSKLYFYFNPDFYRIGKSLFKVLYKLKTNNINYNITKKPSNTIGFIPADLGLTIDGLSGVKIYNALTINQRFLPKAYPNSLKFLITKVDHDISNNNWSTTLGSLSVPKTSPLDINLYKNLSIEISSQVINVSNEELIAAASKGITDEEAKNNIQIVAQYLKDAGVTIDGAKGLIGNLYYESAGMQTNIVETVRSDAGYVTSAAIGGKGGFGLAQWTGQNEGERRRKMESAAGGSIEKRNTIEFQAGYLVQELETSYNGVLKELKSSTDYRQATIVVLEKFEVPGSYLEFKRNPNATTKAAYDKTKIGRIKLAAQVSSDVEIIYNQ